MRSPWEWRRLAASAKRGCVGNAHPSGRYLWTRGVAVRCVALGSGGVSPPSRSEATPAIYILGKMIPMDLQVAAGTPPLSGMGYVVDDTYGLAGGGGDAASPKGENLSAAATDGFDRGGG